MDEEQHLGIVCVEFVWCFTTVSDRALIVPPPSAQTLHHLLGSGGKRTGGAQISFLIIDLPIFMSFFLLGLVAIIFAGRLVGPLCILFASSSN